LRLDEDLKYFEEPEFKDILAKYEEARESGTFIYLDADEFTDIAEYYAMVAQDDAKADEVIELALEIHPGAVDPQIFRARQFMLKGDLEKSRELCDAIEDQSHREVSFLRAELMVREGLLNEAKNFLLDIAETTDEDLDFFLYDSAYIFIDYRRFEQAMTFVNRLEEMAPDWYKTWQVKADALLSTEDPERCRKALPYINRMLDVDPFSIEAWNWSSEAYTNLGDYNKAVESADYGLAIEPENERSLQLKAWVLLQQGNCEEAHRLYVQLQGINPESEHHWLYDSYALLDLEKLDAAEKTIMRAEQLAKGMSPDQQAIFEQCAHVVSRKGEVDRALAYLDKADELKSSDDDDFDPRLLRMRVYASNDRLTEALNYLRETVEKNENEQQVPTPMIYYHGAVVLFDYSYFEEAYQIFEELAALGNVDNLHFELYGFMGFAAMELGREDDALKNLRKAIELKEPHLSELFADKFPNVMADELYDYYYYKVYGRWPD